MIQHTMKQGSKWESWRQTNVLGDSLVVEACEP